MSFISDQIFAFDYKGTGRADHLVLYRPGTGLIYIVENHSGTFATVFASSDGIGGYDLASGEDRIIPLDYNLSGRRDHLLCYRPGAGVVFILSHRNEHFHLVSHGEDGIGGYDLRSLDDQLIAFDLSESGQGNCADLLAYRPGTGTVHALLNTGSAFQWIATSNAGLAGFTLSSPLDRIFPLALGDSKRKNCLLAYRPGAGVLGLSYVERKKFHPYSSVGYGPNGHGAGIGGYDLLSPSDQLLAYDYAGTGQEGHVLAYRPGAGVAWVLEPVSGYQFRPVFGSAADLAQGGPGIGGFDLLSPFDRIVPFDFESKGASDHLVVYRPGTSMIWILQNTGGNFSPVYQNDYLNTGFTIAKRTALAAAGGR